MQNKFSFSKLPVAGLVMCIIIILSCAKELPTHLEYTAYTFSSADEDGGDWKPVLLASPNQIPIDAPQDVSSAAYLDELADLKSAMSNLNDKQREAIEYWTNNPAIRWNEIALELAAKYNLIPGPNPDGTYTLPNAANPAGPPPFPFAHPPYTCRMLAYLSVAQFDAMISAWHYKYTYDRPTPSKVDNSIQAAYTDNNIPAYPSDGAAIATVSKSILTAMFPLEAEYIAGLAEEHLSSLTWSGSNVESDVTAGEFIGTEVAKIALARAANDGMKFAQCPKPVSDSIKAAAFNTYGWQWNNLEVPPRPVGLTPLFSKVRLWNVPNVEAVRPGPPPAPGTAEFNEAAAELEKFAENRTVEQRSIANFWNDGLGSYTPPGHWNRLTKELIIQYKFNPLRSARAFAYLNMAIMDAGIACWDTKYHYHYPRPIQTIQGFHTILGTPNFPAYTSGHSTFSAAAAEVVAYIFPDEATKAREWADEAAVSRIYGGIHYRFDAEVGIQQGKDVAQYTIAVAQGDGAD